jgi:hypothetical protein
MVAADRRYEWREDDGVIVVRSVDAWNNHTSLLDRPVDGITLDNVVVSDAFGVLRRLVGVTASSLALGDTKRFSVEIPKDSSLLQALDAIARAHGSLTWAIQPTSTRDVAFPTTMSLFVGSTGAGFGIPASAVAPATEHTARTPVATEPAPNPTIVTGRRPAAEELSPLDRIVGTRADGRPLVAHGVAGSSVRELATAARVPMGLEWLSPTERQVRLHPGFDGVTLTGMTLHNALATLVALDPRYEWRDLGGVIVFRPVTEWREPLSPLYHTVGGVRLEDTTVAKAIGAFTSLVGSPEHARNSFPDTRTFTVDVPRGTVLDVLNGIARSHGEMYWEWEPLSPSEREFFGGRRFSVHFWVLGGGGLGFAIP